jgi:RNA polymerase sigma-70 factor (ECF subfamily)
MIAAELAADTPELRTLPRLARSASMAQAAQHRFTRTASNLSPATPLEPAEEDKQSMVGGATAVADIALIARAQAGDHAAFEEIFNQYQTQIYNYIYRLMGSAEDAFDMTQDTFLKAYLALPKTSDDLRVGAWLYRIATNVCLDELRHRKLVKWQPWEAFISVFHPTQVAKDSPERDTIDKENNEEVQFILDRLHPKYRTCLILREYHDLSYDEIAEVLNTTRAAVKSLLFRAREEFRQVYTKVERKPGRAIA